MRLLVPSLRSGMLKFKVTAEGIGLGVGGGRWGGGGGGGGGGGRALVC